MNITIDGRPITIEGKPTLLAAARANGIAIPSLCDHPDLRPFTGCRLCLVEISGRRDFAPACGTYPEEGMSIRTHTPELDALRRGILELILIEHPHACLICAEKAGCDEFKSTIRKVADVTGCVLCPNNGRCDLQNVVEAVGVPRVPYPAVYRNFDVRREDPFFDRDLNLCILCGKCIRVCEEVRGASVLSFVHRGPKTFVSTAFDRPLLESGCRFCGACVDVCPTGALVERVQRSQPRPEKTTSVVCPLCGQGCRLDVETREGRVLSTPPDEAGPVNRGQACVRGRFLVRSIVDGDKRLLKPMVRQNGELVPAGWDEALAAAAAGLARFGPNETALVFSPLASLEDAHMFFRFGREVLKTDRVAGETFPSVWSAWEALVGGQGSSAPPGYRLAAVSEASTVLTIGIDAPVDHPMAWLGIVKSLDRGGRLIAAGFGRAADVPSASLRLTCRPGQDHVLMASLASCLAGNPARKGGDKGRRAWDAPLEALTKPARLAAAGIDREQVEKAAGMLSGDGLSAVLVDDTIAVGPDGGRNLALARNLALLAGARFILLGRGGNERGIHELARRASGPARIPADDIALGLGAGTVKALVQAGPMPGRRGRKPEFLVCLDTHLGPDAADADVVFPAAAFIETTGIFVNTEGRIQSSPAAVGLPGEARPDWLIVSLLGRRMGAEGFGHEDARPLRDEVLEKLAPGGRPGATSLATDGSAFVSGGEPEIPGLLAWTEPEAAAPGTHGVRLAVRWSNAAFRGLDAAREIKGLRRLVRPGSLSLNPADAAAIGAGEGQEVEAVCKAGTLTGNVHISEVLPPGTAEAVVGPADPAEREFLGRRVVHVKLRRKT